MNRFVFFCFISTNMFSLVSCKNPPPLWPCSVEFEKDCFCPSYVLEQNNPQTISASLWNSLGKECRPDAGGCPSLRKTFGKECLPDGNCPPLLEVLAEALKCPSDGTPCPSLEEILKECVAVGGGCPEGSDCIPRMTIVGFVDQWTCEISCGSYTKEGAGVSDCPKGTACVFYGSHKPVVRKGYDGICWKCIIPDNSPQK
jgi:hypothetical protein